MSFKDTIVPLTLATKTSASVSAGYEALNGSGMAGPAFFIRINNDTDQDVTISYDGTADHEFLASGQVLELATQTNAQPNSNRAQFKKGTILYVKGTAGSGNIYLSGFYQN